MPVQHKVCRYKLVYLLGSALMVAWGFVGCGGDDSSDVLFGAGNDPQDPGRLQSSADAGMVPLEPDPADIHGGENYGKLVENEFVTTETEPRSTFSIDVDTASYSIMRRDLGYGILPHPDGVRIEEYINYFDYTYPQPKDAPFSINLEAAPSFFESKDHLLRIGLQGYKVQETERKAANLVFLIDISGSMQDENKLPLVKYALSQLVQRLRPTDTLGIAVYAGSEGVVLKPTAADNKSKILDAIDGLRAGGSTNGEAGIKLAYSLAQDAMIAGGINRVVLCTDGDFNVGLTGDDLVALIEAYRAKGITLSVLGFGMGNYNDQTMEQLADKGNGNYAYVDSPQEATRVLGEKLVSTLQVIAKDVKVQVEFNPAAVTSYRLVGYENRLLKNEDFTDDRKDAGEIGAGHNVTAFYELALSAGIAPTTPAATVRIRYKDPDGETSKELEQTLTAGQVHQAFDLASEDFRFASAVMEYAEILRQSKYSQGARFDDVIAIASGTSQKQADRAELIQLVQKAKTLWSREK